MVAVCVCVCVFRERLFCAVFFGGSSICLCTN